MGHISYPLTLSNSSSVFRTYNPEYSREVREISADIIHPLLEENPALLKDGNLGFDNKIVDNGLLKRPTLNGPCLIFDQIDVDQYGDLILTTGIYDGPINNTEAYIFKRVREDYGIHKIFKTEYKNNRFIIKGYTPFPGGNHSVTSSLFGPRVIVKSKFFPVQDGELLLLPDNYTGHDLDTFNGITSIDISVNNSGINPDNYNYDLNYMFGAAIPCIHPFLTPSDLFIENSSSVRSLGVSSITNSDYDIIEVYPQDISFSAIVDRRLEETETLYIKNNSHECLFLESQEPIQINNKVITPYQETIIPDGFNELQLKMTRQTPRGSHFFVDIGVYDNYDHVKKYISRIRIYREQQ